LVLFENEGSLEAPVIVLALTACLDRNDVLQVEINQATSDARSIPPVTCTEVSEACGRLLGQHGAACLELTESAPASLRAEKRQCALDDFRQALAHLPAESDRLFATRGLAEALRVQRDNTTGPERAAAVAELDSLAQQLRGLSGGQVYADYYLANNKLNRVYTKDIPAAQACASLAQARDEVSNDIVPQELSARMANLLQDLSTAMRSRSCPQCPS
jgi:hypothetical protein